MTPVGSAVIRRGVAWPAVAATRADGPAWAAAAYAGAVALLVVLAAVLAAAAAPIAAGYRPVIVNGGSMGDSIPNGSLVMARWVDAGEIAAGDVVLVQGPGDSARPRVHRIVDLQRSGGQVTVRTRGDANATDDPAPFTLPPRVLTSAYHLPYAGHLLGFIRTPPGWLLFVALPGTLLCALTLRAIWLPPRRTPVLAR